MAKKSGINVAGNEVRHGFARGSRGDFMLGKEWIGEFGGANQFEGGKYFPTLDASGLREYSQEDLGGNGDLPSADVPADGYICSGGNTDAQKDIANYTDAELMNSTLPNKEPWPRTNVTAGQPFEIVWRYVPLYAHKTRGYIVN